MLVFGPQETPQTSAFPFSRGNVSPGHTAGEAGVRGLGNCKPIRFSSASQLGVSSTFSVMWGRPCDPGVLWLLPVLGLGSLQTVCGMCGVQPAFGAGCQIIPLLGMDQQAS